MNLDIIWADLLQSTTSLFIANIWVLGLQNLLITYNVRQMVWSRQMELDTLEIRNGPISGQYNPKHT